MSEPRLPASSPLAYWSRALRFAFTDAPPAPDQLRPGDQVVLLLYSAIAWKPERGMLVWTDGRTRAAREILSDGPGFALVEVR